jgi:hypothetical protein
MLVDSRALERAEVGHLDSFNQLHREHAPRRQVAIDLWNHDVGTIREIAGDNLAVARFVDEVELYRDVLEDFARDHAEVEVGLEPCEQAQGEAQVAQIGVDNRFDPRVLYFDRATAAVDRTRRMDLRERSGRNRDRVELAEHRFKRSPQFTLDLSAHNCEGPRRHAVVQSGQRRDPFVRQNVGAGCDKLARLD